MLTQIFEKVKCISFSEVVEKFYVNPGRSGFVRCPFHTDREPSFKIYQDGGHCYGCGWHGDGVDLVAGLQDISKVEAARRIAGVFNIPVDREPTREERQKLNELQRTRRAVELYKAWEAETFRDLADLKSYAERVLEAHGLDVPADLLALVHKIGLIGNWLDILATGTAAEKKWLFNELQKGGDVKKWMQKKI